MRQTVFCLSILLAALPGLGASPIETSAPAGSLVEISDRRYLARILALIQIAQESIEVSIYQILLAEGDETHPVYRILKALADARKRGVRIRVTLNRHLDYVSGETVPLARSLAAYEFLTRNGIEVVFADPARRLHDKLIIIDGRWVIEGSMNWTKTALQSNWESATLIDSPEYAAEKLARIRAIPLSTETSLDTLGDEGELLNLPSILLTDPKYFPKLLEAKDERIFEFYLWLLKDGQHLSLIGFHNEGAVPSIKKLSSRKGQVSGKGKFILGDETLFEHFGLDSLRNREDKRRESLRLLKKLKKRGLIDLNFQGPGSEAEITLKPLAPSSSNFTIPFTYFEYGYPRRLSFAGEFIYLVARKEMAESASPPWWWRPQEYLTSVYHLHHTTVASGMLELQRENGIEIIRDDAPEGGPPSERLVNRYRVNRLVSPGQREEQQRGLIEKFGRKKWDSARRFADTIDEPNDPVVLATLLKWLDLYPAKNLESAFEQVSRYERNNPRRSLYYIHGILEGMEGSAP